MLIFFKKKKKLDVNDATNHHDPFPDTNDHLGYRQVATRSSEDILWDQYEVQICNWEDGNFGRTIRDKIRSCGALTAWKFEDSTHKFADGYSAEKYASFRLPILMQPCVDRKLEELLGLSKGSVTCDYKFKDVSMF